MIIVGENLSNMAQDSNFSQPGPLTIGDVEVSPPILLAPMAGVTDDIFRSLAAANGAGMVTTEMVSVEGLRRSQPTTWKLCTQDAPLSVPLAVQLFGREPGAIAQAAGMLEANGVRVVDINAGCPVKKVAKQGAGASLLRDPDHLARIVESVKQAVSIPVTVKLRIGWNQETINVVEVAQRLESAGADALSIHGRTAVQLYSGTADWSWIQNAKRAVKIPIIGNGDVSSPGSATRMMLETGCDGVMIGRASVGNPWIFAAIATKWGFLPPVPPPTGWADFHSTVRSHLDDYVSTKRKPAGHCRQVLIRYSKGRPDSARLRAELYGLERTEEMLHAFSEWIDDLIRRDLPFEAVGG